MTNNNHPETTNQPDPLADIVFVELPMELERTIGEFELDPTRKLPVEIPPGQQVDDLTGLSWEMIVSAMLKILAYQPTHHDADYYREFVLAVRPQLVEELTETGIVKAKNQDYDIAEEIFLALRGLLPGDTRPLLNLALLYEQRAELSERREEEAEQDQYDNAAFHTYQELLTHDDAPADAAFNAAFFFLKRRNYNRAHELMQRYRQEGDDDKKLAEAERIVTEIEEENLLDELFKESYDFIRMGKEKEGIEKIRRFLKTHPDVWNAWFLLGWGLRRLSRFQEAGEAFEYALKHGGENADTLNELAICRLEMEHYREALENLQKALKLEPDNPKIISNLGVLSLRTGKTEDARAYFATALEIEPNDPVASTYLQKLEHET